ncbi:MAG: hypothetical protein B6D63_06750 [Candidatus Latescibacteria bacterium 4484_7]|nr:MAG: hypothetical protein B6D63_06750 [Candidatus Latescibacteria bacterium 4484_7]
MLNVYSSIIDSSSEKLTQRNGSFKQKGSASLVGIVYCNINRETKATNSFIVSRESERNETR